MAYSSEISHATLGRDLGCKQVYSPVINLKRVDVALPVDIACRLFSASISIYNFYYMVFFKSLWQPNNTGTFFAL